MSDQSHANEISTMGATCKDSARSASIWADYRSIRKGIIGGSRLESVLRKDLEWLVEVQHRGTISEIELMFARQSIEAVHELFAETGAALDSFIHTVERMGVLDRTDRVIEAINATVTDESTRMKIVNTLLLNGGVRHYVEAIRSRVSVRDRVYKKALQRLINGGASALPDVASDVTINLDALTREELKEYWRKKLEEEKGKEEGVIVFSSVGWELCMKYPEIARELGVQCPNTEIDVLGGIIVGVIIILVAIAWVCEN